MSQRPAFVNTVAVSVAARPTKAEAHSAAADESLSKSKRKKKKAGAASAPGSPKSLVGAPAAAATITGLAPQGAAVVGASPKPAKSGKKKTKAAGGAQVPSTSKTGVAFFSDASYVASPPPAALPVPQFGDRAKSSDGSNSQSASPPRAAVPAFQALVQRAAADPNASMVMSASHIAPVVVPPVAASPPTSAFQSLLDKVSCGEIKAVAPPVQFYAMPAPMYMPSAYAPAPAAPMYQVHAAAMAEQGLRRMLNVQDGVATTN